MAACDRAELPKLANGVVSGDVSAPFGEQDVLSLIRETNSIVRASRLANEAVRAGGVKFTPSLAPNGKTAGD